MNGIIGMNGWYGINWNEMSKTPLESGYLLNWADRLLVYADITRGWTGYVDGSLALSYYVDQPVGSPYYLIVPATTNGQIVNATTANKVDVTDIKTLQFTVYLFGSGSHDVSIGIADTKTGAFTAVKTQYVYNSTSTALTLDLRSYSGDYYILIRHTQYNSTVRVNNCYIAV